MQLTEKHLGQMTEMNLAHLKEKPKERSLGCSSAERTAMQMVLMTERCWVELTVT